MRPLPVWQSSHQASGSPLKWWMRKPAGFQWLGISPRYLNTMTRLCDSSARENWKRSTSLIAHNWRLSSTCASGVVLYQRQNVLSSEPLALANPCPMMPTGFESTWPDSDWNFPRFTRQVLLRRKMAGVPSSTSGGYADPAVPFAPGSKIPNILPNKGACGLVHEFG